MYGSQNYLFIELLQVAIGRRTSFSHPPTLEQWKMLFQMSQEQAVAGVCLSALEVLYKTGQKAPQELTLKWVGLAEQIKVRNRRLNICSVEISDFFSNEGYRSCILKGQGNASYYPDPLLRNSGDIDIWIDGTRAEITTYVHERYNDVRECEWHIDFPYFDDVPVEVHYIPSYLRSPKHNKRLQKYFEENKVNQYSNSVHLHGTKGSVSIPTAEFNLFQQLSHVMRHFFIEGVGIRQIMDLYYLIASYRTELNRDRIQALLKYFGMLSFARGVMWILQKLFCLEEECLVVDPDKRRGKLILDEILSGGNWGRYDKRCTGLSKINGLLPFIVRNTRFVLLFPYEAIVVPLRRRVRF